MIFRIIKQSLFYSCIVLFALISAEIFYRVNNNIEILSFDDWRKIEINFNKNNFVKEEENPVVELDEKIGWLMKPFSNNKGFNTIEYGIRKNKKNSELTYESVLAVGDSFTAGSEVVDDSNTART